jgi:hypothetical protein
MNPRSALDRLIGALEAFHLAASTAQDPNAPSVAEAADALADAYIVYDDVVFTRFGVEAPLDIYGDDDEYEDDLEDDDYDDFDLDDDEEADFDENEDQIDENLEEDDLEDDLDDEDGLDEDESESVEYDEDLDDAEDYEEESRG